MLKMTNQNINKNTEELKQASFDLRLLTECLKQISDLCHREDINGYDICHITDLLQKDQNKLVEKFLKNTLSIEYQVKNKVVQIKPNN